MNWLVVLIVTLLAALVLQAGLLAFAMYVLLGVLLTSRYLAQRWVRDLGARRECDAEPIEVGESVEVKLRVRNRGTIPVAWVLIEDLLPESALKQRPARIKVKGRRLKLVMIRAGKSVTLKYRIEGLMRGYYQIGPLLLETGDLFGLHRRHRVVTKPVFLMVYPKVIPLPRYDFSSMRPIGEVKLAHLLFEDPTRSAGVRPYQVGDPLQRVHWRATARTGELHSRVYEPTSLAGATLLLDFHQAHYHRRGEPYRSELAVTVTASLSYAVAMLGQQVGVACNARDAADRARLEQRSQPEEMATETDPGFETRDAAREVAEMFERNDRLRPVQVETRRGIEQFQRIREALARVEFTDAFSFAQLVLEMTPRLPRDATVIAVLPAVPVETSIALGTLRRQGFAVSAILIGLEDEERMVAHGRLLAEGVRDVRSINTEEELGMFGQLEAVAGETPYEVEQALI